MGVVTTPAERRGQRPPSILLEHRSLRPGGPRGAPDDAEVVPNSNLPGDVPPGTVGADAYNPGDPNGVEVAPLAAPIARSLIRASPWSGWPADWDTPLWGNGSSHFDALVDTVWACYDLNARVLSTMPPYTVKGDRVVPAPLWASNPNPDKYTSWEEFAKQLFWDFQHGEVFVLCTARYADGWPARFHVVEPHFVNAEMVDGLRRYTIGGWQVPDDDMLHIRYKSTTSDARGHGPLEAGRHRVLAAYTLQRYAANLASGGGIPYYVLETADHLTAKESNDLLNQWWTSRTNHLGEPGVLSGGVTAKVMQFNAKEMALLELGQFNEAHLAVLLGVPPFLVGLPSGGDSMTYSNVSHLFDYHWRSGLRTLAQPVMAAMSQWALPYGSSLEVNRDEYVRPDLAARAAAYATLHGIVDEDGPALTVAEIRRMERLNGTAAAAVITGGMVVDNDVEVFTP